MLNLKPEAHLIDQPERVDAHPYSREMKLAPDGWALKDRPSQSSAPSIADGNFPSHMREKSAYFSNRT
ncbi:MAG: hypothetical protein ACFCU4_06210 [Puniceicoccaceae bacterium]